MRPAHAGFTCASVVQTVICLYMASAATPDIAKVVASGLVAVALSVLANSFRGNQ